MSGELADSVNLRLMRETCNDTVLQNNSKNGLDHHVGIPALARERVVASRTSDACSSRSG